MFARRLAVALLALLATAQPSSAQTPLDADPRGLLGDERGLRGERHPLDAGRRRLSGRIRALVGDPAPYRRRRSRRALIHFRFDDDALRKPARRRLRRLVNGLDRETVLSVRVGGHADAIGSGSYNLDLSRRRAERTCRFLRERLRVRMPECDLAPRGERRPIAPNRLPNGADNFSGRRLNRRAVVVVRTNGSDVPY